MAVHKLDTIRVRIARELKPEAMILRRFGDHYLAFDRVDDAAGHPSSTGRSHA